MQHVIENKFQSVKYLIFIVLVATLYIIMKKWFYVAFSVLVRYIHLNFLEWVLVQSMGNLDSSFPMRYTPTRRIETRPYAWLYLMPESLFFYYWSSPSLYVYSLASVFWCKKKKQQKMTITNKRKKICVKSIYFKTKISSLTKPGVHFTAIN